MTSIALVFMLTIWTTILACVAITLKPILKQK